VDRFQGHSELGNRYLNRAATSEYILFGNTATTAVYYNAFTDNQGNLLNTSTFPFTD
jgi:hypothetical protein